MRATWSARVSTAWGFLTSQARRISYCSKLAIGPFPSATPCEPAASWCATAVTKSRAVSASPPARARRPPGFWKSWRNCGYDNRLRHGRRARGSQRVLPRSHRANRRALHRRTRIARSDPATQERGRVEQRLGAVAKDRRRYRRRNSEWRSGRLLQPDLHRRERRQVDQPRKLVSEAGIARAFAGEVRTGALHRAIAIRGGGNS